MKLPIKFRGRFFLKSFESSDIKSSLNDGDYVYGGYARIKFWFEYDDEGDFIIDNSGVAWLVYPDSVAQLIGYDADGNEVYEGDKLKIGDEIVTVNWNNDTTCFSVKWKNGLEDSFGTVRYHYDSKPYLVREKIDE